MLRGKKNSGIVIIFLSTVGIFVATFFVIGKIGNFWTFYRIKLNFNLSDTVRKKKKKKKSEHFKQFF